MAFKGRMRIFLNYLPRPSSDDWGDGCAGKEKKLYAWREERLEGDGFVLIYHRVVL